MGHGPATDLVAAVAVPQSDGVWKNTGSGSGLLQGRIVCEVKVASEPDVLIGRFGGLEFRVTRMGLEAGQLSQWLYAGMRDAGLAVELLETRHVRDAFKAMPVKTDGKDAPGIAQLDAAGLVPVGALQIATGAGSPSTTDSAQAAADQKP